MAMTLDQMRLFVRKFVDDVARARWDTDGLNTDVDNAIGIGCNEALAAAVNAGSTRFRTTANFTSTNAGLVDLTNVKPLRIHTVRASTGIAPNQQLVVVPTVGQDGYSLLHPFVETLSITYTPAATIPASGASPITWGGGGDTPELDNLACMIAASHMKVVEGEENPVLERRKAELLATVRNLPDTQRWVQETARPSYLWAMPRPFLWLQTNGYQLQLVER